MKPLLCALLVLLLAGCSLTTPRWKQALIDSGVSQECVDLIKSQTCPDYMRSSKHLYQAFDGAKRELIAPGELLVVDGIKELIIKNLTVLINLPECEVKK